jgi:putative nucleotidyltransferase with HDIG domain
MLNLAQHLQHKIFSVIAQVASEKSIDAFVVGGFVRDLIMQRPNKDIDIVVLGSGTEFAEAVANKLHIQKVSFFKNFGTAMFKWRDLEIEFVGARKESYQRHSRKPIVENGSLEDDQLRRDFTINALAISLHPSDFGKVIDPFGGVNHITEKMLITPQDPNITFSDDPLRMMRAVRFATTLQFTLHPSLFTAIQKEKERIKIISAERISEELNKIILANKPSIGFDILFQTGLLEIIFPEMTALYGTETIEGKGHKDNFYHTLQVLDNIAHNTQNLWLRWAAILHDIAKPKTKKYQEGHGWTFHGHEDKGARMVPAIFKRFRLPADAKMKYVQKLVALHLRPVALAKEEVSDSGIRRLLFDAGEDLDDLLTLCSADITSKNPRKVERILLNYKIVKEKLKEVEEKDRLRNWQPPISGEEIMQMFQLPPGRMVGELKTAVREAILDGKIANTKVDAISFIKNEALQKGILNA